MRVPLTIITALLGALLSVTGYYAHEVAQLGQRVARIEGRMGLAVTRPGTNALQVHARPPSPEPASIEEK